MARKKESDQLTPLELEIMKVLWDNGDSTVQEVLDGLPGARALAYTTVQTMLNVLHKKGKVNRVAVEGGRALRYQAAVRKQAAMRQVWTDLVQRVFGGSAEQMVLSMVESKVVPPSKLRELERLVAESKPKGKDRGER